MNTAATSNPNDPDQALKTLRILWAGITFGLVAAGSIIAAITFNHPDPGPVTLGPVRVGTLALAALVIFMAVGYFIRLQTYKSGWITNRVKPTAYVQGNLILFAMIEAVGMLSVILGGFIGDRFACFAIATAALFALILNFPNGGPLRPAEPRL
ncbi:MAG: hypothetical protein AAF328_03710 [Planctomycetota bacterium]